MTLPVTLTIILIASAVLVFAIYKARQPYRPGMRFHVPYLAIQFIAILTIILMLGHLVTLLTGKPFAGRLG